MRWQALCGILGSLWISACAPVEEKPSFVSTTALHAGLGLSTGLAVLQVYNEEGTGIGSAGFIEGLGLVSATHVLPGQGGFLRLSNGHKIPVKVLRAYEDVVLLDGEGPARLPRGECPRVGDMVGMMGSVYPYLIFGKVVSKEVRISVNERLTHGFIVQARIRPGFSGGPVVDAQGRAIGVNSGAWKETNQSFIAFLNGLDGSECR